MDLLAPWLAGLVLLAAVVLACMRLLRRYPAGPWRNLLLLAQPLMAVLLYLALFPPLRPVASATMTVLTADAQHAQAGARGNDSGLRIALPEASGSDAESSPDLATALRRHPGVTQLHVLGAGLTARDRDAARGLALGFEASPAPTGLVDLHAPREVLPGNIFNVSGRIAGLPGATVELLDPAGESIQRVTIDSNAQFTLRAAVRAPGATSFSIQVRNAAGALHEVLPLPIAVTAPPAMRVLVLAGAPGPELKYLRRWALDAGIRLHTRTSAGAGLTLGDAPLRLDADTLDNFDAVLLDARALRALRDADRRALGLALHAGLGLLLRIDDALAAGERRLLQEWGFDVDAGDALVATHLPEPAAQAGTAARGFALPALTRRDLRPASGDAVPLLPDSQQRPLAWWRAAGRGRIGLVTLTDSYRLTLAGFSERHGQLWSTLLGAVARRAHGVPPPTVSWPLWQSGRAVLCGLADGAAVIAPDGTHIALAVDPATGPRRCAAMWPGQAGWHRLQQGDTEVAFAVLPADSGMAWQAQRQLDATALLAATAPDAVPATGDATQRGPALPWLAAWLLLSVMVWLAERRLKAAALFDAAEAVGQPAA